MQSILSVCLLIALGVGTLGERAIAEEPNASSSNASSSLNLTMLTELGNDVADMIYECVETKSSILLNASLTAKASNASNASMAGCFEGTCQLVWSACFYNSSTSDCISGEKNLSSLISNHTEDLDELVHHISTALNATNGTDWMNFTSMNSSNATSDWMNFTNMSLPNLTGLNMSNLTIKLENHAHELDELLYSLAYLASHLNLEVSFDDKVQNGTETFSAALLLNCNATQRNATEQ